MVMSRSAPSTGAEQDAVRASTQRAIGALLVPIFFVAMFSLCIIGTYHKPHPNDIRVGIVGPAQLTGPLRAQLAQRAGSSFEIVQVTTVDEAQHAVRQRDLDAALVPTPDPSRPATLVV